MILDLFWDPERVKALFSDHGITNRSALAHRLAEHGIGRTTIYRSFDETWAGKATIAFMAILHNVFGADLSELVTGARKEHK
jgi:hypothetical protein